MTKDKKYIPGTGKVNTPGPVAQTQPVQVHAAQVPSIPKKRVLVFNGPIQHQTTVSFRIGLCQMVNEGATDITILFSSTGGSLEDGMSMYAYLAALPVTLTMHAVGYVKSIAVPIFLVAPNRFVSSNARFLLHEYTWGTAHPENATQTQIAERTLVLNDVVSWSKDIIKSTTKFKDEHFESMHLFDRPRILGPAECTEWGIASEIRDPKILMAESPRVVA